MKGNNISKLKEGIYFSKSITEWICAWCQEPIDDKKYSLILHRRVLVNKYNHRGEIVKTEMQNNGIGVRIHVKCIDEMCDKLKEYRRNNIKELILDKL